MKKPFFKVKDFITTVNVKQIIMNYLFIIACGMAASYIFKLKPAGYIIVFVASLFATTLIIKYIYKMRHERNRYEDVSSYIEKMLYYFKQTERILDSLEAAVEIFPEKSDMAKAIQSAISHIQEGSEENVMQNALEIIESNYPNSRIKSMHRFMLKVEENGGDCGLGIDMLLKDQNNWSDRMAEFTFAQKNSHMTILASIIMSVIVSALLLYIPDMANIDIDLSLHNLEQTASTLFICSMLLFYAHSLKKMAVDIVNDIESDNMFTEMYSKVMNYDAHKKKTGSYLFTAMITVVLFIVCWLSNNFKIFIFSIPVIVLIANLHKIRYKVQFSQVKRKISEDFPFWLLNVALLMETENVQVAIAKSYPDAPPILKPALENMLSQLLEDPNAKEPFLSFLSRFELPEVKESMSTLYSIDTERGGNISIEFENIINRNIKQLNRAETLKNEDRTYLFEASAKIPMYISICKITVDFILLTMEFFIQMNSFL